MFTTDLKTVWAGGKRYIPIDIDASVAQQAKRYATGAMPIKINMMTISGLDLRLGIRMNNKKFSQEWGIDLQNITGYRSIFMEGFDPKKGEIYKVYQQGFVPMFLYRIRF